MPEKTSEPEPEQPGENNKWIKKEGYETRLVANAADLSSTGTEAQMVRFLRGKSAHHHKEE